MTTPEPAPADYNTLRRCRALRADGVQCRQRALRGQDLCMKHTAHRFPTFPDPKKIRIPLLEDHSSIQLIATQIMQGMLSGTISQKLARTAFYGCQVANSLLPRPARPQSQPIEEPIVEIDCDMEGIPVGPREKYKGPTGAFEPQWSLSKYRYEMECERLGKPKPTCAEDFPASGWLTEDEIKEDPNHFCDRYEARIRTLREQKQQREQNQQKCDPSRQEHLNPAEQEQSGTAEQEQKKQPDQPREGTVDLQATADPQPAPKPGLPRICRAIRHQDAAWVNPALRVIQVTAARASECHPKKARC